MSGLSLPAQSETSASLAARLPSVAARRDTAAYIDTSFLMWMTKIGPLARGELVTWLNELFGERLRVPVWAAHEYYRHHTERTIVKELEKELESLEKVGKTTYNLLWPLLQGDPTPATQSRQTEIREILRALPEVGLIGKSWVSTYEENAAEVITFVNARGLKGSRISDYFETLDAVAEARFTGRVPPGFKDRGKKEISAAEGAQTPSPLAGSNRWGDFVFWREILDDAERRRPRAILILTRDGKNDWRSAGQPPPCPDPTDKNGLAPVHPYLAFEAGLRSGAKEVLLLDDARLAAAAELNATPTTAAFVAASRLPPLPNPKSQSERRQDDQERETTLRAQVRATVATTIGFDFLDPSSVRATGPQLRRALYESRSDRPIPQSVVDLEAKLGTQERTLAEHLDEDCASELGCTGLVVAARRLGASAKRSVVMAASLSDLCDRLPRLPPNVGSSVYLGFLADAYLDDTNKARPAPRSSVLQALFGFQGEAFAREPIRELRERLSKEERMPVYVPDSTRPSVTVTLKADSERDPRTTLRSILVKELDLLTPASLPELQTTTLLQGRAPSSEELVATAVELYGLPDSQLIIVSDVDSNFVLDLFQGFREPRDVWISPEEKRQ
jgi:hypothetical protein